MIRLLTAAWCFFVLAVAICCRPSALRRFARAVWAFIVITFLTTSFVYALISPGPFYGGPL
jgi:membrane-anchored protein YejM (alkaline phosphatase superfamily)